MRLLKTDTFELAEFVGEGIPKYAILSHTWEGKEVSFHDIQQPNALTYLKTDKTPTPAWAKIKHACRLAQEDKFEFIWIDTCCIDKSSSAELQEAINSMFAWYRKSAICYAFLSDIKRIGFYIWQHPSIDITGSRWFTRGWTLQELLAPDFLYFYDASWNKLGSRNGFAESISKATRIPIICLAGPEYGQCDMYQAKDGTFIRTPKTRKRIEDELQKATVVARMSWAANRQTTRVEDEAYCLLGLFDINMPMLYGEGNKAFMRLQHEIMKTSDDATILAWGYGMPIDRDAYMDMANEYAAHNPQMYRQHLREQACKIRPRSLLATSPADFRFAGGLKKYNGSNNLSLEFGISQRGLLLDGLYGFDINSGLQYLFLPCTDPEENVLALPMVSLMSIYRSQSYHDKSLANTLCVPLPTAHEFAMSHYLRHTLSIKQAKYFLCVERKTPPPPSVSHQPFDSGTWELCFRKQPPLPNHGALDFSVETIFPIQLKLPFRFVTDMSPTQRSESHSGLVFPPVTGNSEQYKPLASSQLFILNINGKRILLVLGRETGNPLACDAAMLDPKELLRPTWYNLSQILKDGFRKAHRIRASKSPDLVTQPYLVFKLFPWLELWAKRW